ncbi:MAG: membrane dipeptidase [Deltaproteobacteria bacterium]|nr:membrane dipeptidase [Deltaproteobacteria bacterium]MBW2444814.1 membrane dipeptidase [Deltaproteobacteria bacterium]
MGELEFRDHRADPDAWARELGISREAVEVYLASDVLDLHLDTFIWNRVFGYDLRRRHERGLLGRHFYGQVDFPRILEAQITGGTWVITTNPLRPRGGRPETFVANLARLRKLFATVSDQFAVVRNVAEYRAARAAGKHGAFIGIQGGNALDRELESLDLIADDCVLRITLVHLSSSTLGVTSSPAAGRRKDEGLSDLGRDYVRRLNEKKIFLDLAHINRAGFFDALSVHDKSQPVLVTHTGVTGVHPHWRNLDDEQLRAVADLGGTIGVMYQESFLGKPPCTTETVVDHVEHIVNTVGEDHASLGSDWDGAISPPRDLTTCLDLPRVADRMLQRGWSPERVQKILGGNFLRTVEMLRG